MLNKDYFKEKTTVLKSNELETAAAEQMKWQTSNTRFLNAEIFEMLNF